MSDTTPPRDTTEAEALDILTPFIDALARAMYLDLDSHAATMTWDQYRADDPTASRLLYVDPMARYVLRALPKFPPSVQTAARDAAQRADALREAADEWEQEDTDAVGDWLREIADRIGGKPAKDHVCDAGDLSGHCKLCGAQC